MRPASLIFILASRAVIRQAIVSVAFRNASF